jgi:glycyl-tRNA synthetase beta chain
VALADKIDSVVGLMKVGERATGSRDPFGLRRQTQGIVKILMDLPELAGIDREIGIGALVEIADPLLPGAAGPSWDPASVATFAQERIRYALEQRGFSLGQIRSAVSGANHDNPLRARRIAEALKGLEGSDDLRALAVLFKRVKNIARELKEHAKLDRSALTEPAEAALLSDLDARRPRIAQAIGAKDYRRALTEIAGLRPSVDRFFTEVFVMVEDARLRTARLMLMADLRDLVLDLADISEIVPQAE